MNHIARFLLILGVILLAACGPNAPEVTDCKSSDLLEVVCGFHNPEDLARLPGEDELIVSQFGSMDGQRPGNLALYSLNGDLRVVYRGGEEGVAFDGWGDSSCPGEPTADFAPHGIDLDRRPDGILQLLVVNHGGRESVEFFEVIIKSEEQAALAWRGCVVMQAGLYLNDVVSQSNGGFWATHMMLKGSTWQMITSALGQKHGYVVSWEPGGQVERLAGTEGQFPNGIEKSHDETHLFINMYLMSGVVKYNLASGEIVASIESFPPDNLVWDSDGEHLLVATHSDSLGALMACQEIESGACGFEFKILRLDAETMAGEVLFTQAGPPMGAATVALPVGDALYLGTFAGDRIGIYRR